MRQPFSNFVSFFDAENHEEKLSNIYHTLFSALAIVNIGVYRGRYHGATQQVSYEEEKEKNSKYLNMYFFPPFCMLEERKKRLLAKTWQKLFD